MGSIRNIDAAILNLLALRVQFTGDRDHDQLGPLLHEHRNALRALSVRYRIDAAAVDRIFEALDELPRE